MNDKEVHLKLSEIKIDNDNLDYIKFTGEICGKLREDLVKLFAIPAVMSKCECNYAGTRGEPQCDFCLKNKEDCEF